MIGQAKNATNPARFEVERTDLQRTQKLLTAGGILGALAASSCCVLPLALFGPGWAEPGSAT